MKKESSLVKAIRQYLQYRENSGLLMFQRNNTGALINRWQKKGKFGNMIDRKSLITYGKVGSSDFYVWFATGKMIFIECKSDSGDQSDEQVEFMNKARKLGFEYYLVSSTDEFLNVMIFHGVHR